MKSKVLSDPRKEKNSLPASLQRNKAPGSNRGNLNNTVLYPFINLCVISVPDTGHFVGSVICFVQKRLILMLPSLMALMVFVQPPLSKR